MIVLGINDGHDSGVCLLQDGRIILCSSEERRVNVKNQAGVPARSIAEVLRRSGIDPREVNLVALSSCIRTTVPTPGHKPIYTVLNLLSSLGRTNWGTSVGRWLLSRLRKRQDLLACLADHGLANTTVVPFDHHLTHAATAYFHRPWEGPATVLTLDGAGDGLCATVGVGRGQELTTLAQTPKFHSPAAWMYSAITAHLGLRPYEHEYKVMGMAPYGQPDACANVLRDAFEVAGLQFRNRTGHIAAGMQRYLGRRLAGQRFDNVAAACQQVFEELMLRWVENALAATGIPRIVAAGGAFLNVKANKLIREHSGVESLYVYPASDDGGTPVGAAILGYLQLCREQGQQAQLELPQDMYLGLGFSDAELEAAAGTSGLSYRRMADPAMELSALLAEGKIVGRFSGREELGPRALGNRSILADPRDLRVIRKLNFAIKQRDFWMPFAASVLEEDSPRYIRGLSPWAYYMIEAFDTTPEGGEALIAGTHPFDQTIRPQVVNDLNPDYRDLLRAFRLRTGVGGVLNTSFNLHGYPIVGTPEVALDTLKKSDLDAVALGPILVDQAGIDIGTLPPLTLVILTRDEEQNIGECLASAAGFDDVHVLDCGSTDRTVELASAWGAQVHFHPFESFGRQRNWAIDHIPARHDWHLHLDADERLTPELVGEIATSLAADPKVGGYLVPSKLMFAGRWLRHAGQYPTYQVRLFHCRRLRFLDHGHGQREQTSYPLARLSQPYLHYAFRKGLDHWFAKHAVYARLEAESTLASSDGTRGGLFSRDPTRRRRALKRLVSRLPGRYFLRLFYMLIIRRAFLDGPAGMAYAHMLATYEAMIDVHLKLLRHGLNSKG